MQLDPEQELRELRRKAAAARRSRARLAREDPNAFMELVLRDEQTHQPIVQAPVHEAWQKLITDSDRLIIWSAVELGKTQQVAVGRVLWELGRNPSLRCVVLANVHSNATKIVRLLANYVEGSLELREVFPGLMRSTREKDPWTESRITVERPTHAKDASVEAFGVHGNVTGGRIDLLVVDDILDQENTYSPEQRKKLADWFESTIMGRLTAQSRIVVIGNAWHRDDLLHNLAKRPGWTAVRYPALDDSGQPRWPARWPLARIARRRSEMLPHEFARQLLCQVYDLTQSIFRREAIQLCLARGDGRDLIYALKYNPQNVSVYTGVDLATRKKDSADLTCMFTIAVGPDGSRTVLMVESGRWNGPEIRDHLFDTHRRFGSIFVVEDNAAQKLLIDLVQHESAIPIIPYTTTAANKLSPEFGLQSLAVEFQNAKWVIPNSGGTCRPEVASWVEEMFSYDPQAHTGDRLMASWFAREGIRLAGGREGPRAETAHVDTLTR